MSLSRPTAGKITRRFSCTAILCAGLIGVSAAPGLASDGGSAVLSEASTAVSSAVAVCPGQTFSQPFTALGDSNYYTLVEGSEFNSSSEGWQLIGGAHVLSATRPDGSAGPVL